MKILYPVVASNRDGKTCLLYTAEEVKAFRVGRKVSVEWRYYPFGFGYDWRVKNYQWSYRLEDKFEDFDWILRDDRGRPVDPNLPPFRDNHGYNHRYGEKRIAEIRAAAEKGLPIPGLRRYKRRKCHCYEYCGGNKRSRTQETVYQNALSNDFTC